MSNFPARVFSIRTRFPFNSLAFLFNLFAQIKPLKKINQSRDRSRCTSAELRSPLQLLLHLRFVLGFFFPRQIRFPQPRVYCKNHGNFPQFRIWLKLPNCPYSHYEITIIDCDNFDGFLMIFVVWMVCVRYAKVELGSLGKK